MTQGNAPDRTEAPVEASSLGSPFFGKREEIGVGVNARRVSVRPNDLERISSDRLEGTHDKACRGIVLRFGRIGRRRAAFPLTKGTGTVAPKKLQREVAFPTTLPSDRQFGADDLSIRKSERGGHNLSRAMPAFHLELSERPGQEGRRRRLLLFAKLLLAQRLLRPLDRFRHFGFLDLLFVKGHIGQKHDTLGGNPGKSFADRENLPLFPRLKHKLSRHDARDQWLVIGKDPHFSFHSGKSHHVCVLREAHPFRSDDMDLKLTHLPLATTWSIVPFM